MQLVVVMAVRNTWSCAHPCRLSHTLVLGFADSFGCSRVEFRHAHRILMQGQCKPNAIECTLILA